MGYNNSATQPFLWHQSRHLATKPLLPPTPDNPSCKRGTLKVHHVLPKYPSLLQKWLRSTRQVSDLIPLPWIQGRSQGLWRGGWGLKIERGANRVEVLLKIEVRVLWHVWEMSTSKWPRCHVQETVIWRMGIAGGVWYLFFGTFSFFVVSLGWMEFNLICCTRENTLIWSISWYERLIWKSCLQI